MKRLFLKQRGSLIMLTRLCVLMLCGMVIYSCSDASMNGDVIELPEDGFMNAYTSFGTVDGATRTITQDSGDVLNITELSEQLTNEEVAALSGRIFFNYTVLNTVGLNEYNIRLNCLYDLSIEDAKMLSKMSVEEQEGLGTDPVSPVQATLSGGYVNVQLYYVQSMNTPDTFVHDVELIFDDKASTEETMVLVLRHKGDGVDGFKEECRGIYKWVSFKLTDDIIGEYSSDSDYEQVKKLLVVFHWNWWNDEGEIVEYMGSIEPVPYSNVEFYKEF